MNLLGLIFVLTLSGITSSALASDSDPYTVPKPVVAIDANQDGQITAKSLAEGQDSFLVREAKPTDTRIKGSFTGVDGKTYIPLTSLEQLRILDPKKKGVVTAIDMQNIPLPYLTARILTGTSKVIIERPIWESLISIQFPGKNGGAYTAKINEQDSILIGEVK